MSDGAKISGITIELDKKEISLTPEQAEMLYKALDKMFGEKVVTRVERIMERERYPYPWRWTYGTTVYSSDSTLGGVYGSLKASYDAGKETLCISAK